MVRRKNDPTPVPPGGRAAERLRQFEQARGLEPSQPVVPAGKKGPGKKGLGTQPGREKAGTPGQPPPAGQAGKRRKD